MADITGTNGNDILVFNGMVQQLTMTITNAYSGQSLFIDDEYNNNQSSYEGMAGIDVLTMSSQGDAIFITNSVGVQMLFNIEQILAGQGGDLIVLAHETIELGNVIVDGGAGDDIVWSNIGDDLLRGLGGNDIIDGGPGNDNIQGLNDNDILNGGADADWLQGGNGNDVLEFYADAVWGAGAGTVNVITGEIADLEGLNRSFDTFDGGANNDALTMTGGDDALVLDDPVSARHASTSGARIVAVEVIDGGAGNDVINLTSATYAYGNVTIYGGAGHDVLWSGAGHDVLDGGIGDDRLHGGAGHDILSGGTGTDQLDGGIGDDTLVFSVDDVDGTGRGVTFDTYVGGAGTDTLLMGAGDDAFAFDGTNLNGVEIIAAGLGHDHINLDHATAYGNVTVDAGAGDDYVRASSGDDLLLGGDGDDTLFGNLGNDRVEGGAGNDILYGGDEGSVTTLTHQFNGAVAFPTLTELQALSQAEEAALGLADGDLSVAYTTTATIKFVESGAGYKNSLGYYNIAADGTMQAVEMAFSHVKAAMQGQTYDVTLPGAPDTDFGFFIIADGYSHNNNYSGVNFATGDLNFVYMRGTANERAANINDDAADISLVYTNGATVRVLSGPIYHTTERGGSTALNPDGEEHVVAGRANAHDDSVLRIGFEDLPSLGDADYNDVVFDLSIGSGTVGVAQPGDDVLIGGAGNDVLYGGGGADMFVFTHLDGSVDTLMDFSLAEGDRLNITDILEGFDALNSAIADFVQLTQQGADTVLSVDADGQGGDFVAAAIIEGGQGLDLAALINAGALVTDQSMTL